MNWHKNMGPLDFSKFKDILLEDPDGDIRPQSEPYFKATKLAEGVWQVLSDGDHIYVLEGDDELICIDSGIGAGSIRDFCQSLCPEKPLYRMLLTHFHGNHILNAYQFDCVYMSEDTYRLRAEFAEFQDLNVPEDYPVVFLHDGDVINLKGRPLEVIALDEHAKGSLQFLDRKSRILFCGDELNGNYFDSQISVEHSYRNLVRWNALRPYYDRLAAGNDMHDASYIERYLEIAEYILNGHENEGVALYKPHTTDRISSISELDGKRVFARRAPKFVGVGFEEKMIEAGYGEQLALNDGHFAFAHMRKLGPDGPFDREIVRNGAHFCYFLNKIWDK